MKHPLFFVLALAASLLLAARQVGAQLPKPQDIVQVRLEPAQVKTRPGAAAALTLVATIREGFHINSHRPKPDYLIPTQIELLEAPPFVLDRVAYPAGKLKAFGFSSGEKLSVYEGTVKVPLRLRAKPAAPAGSHTLRLVFRYQACNDQICLRPAQREVTLSVRLQ